MYIERERGRQQRSICARRRSCLWCVWCFVIGNRLILSIHCMLIFGWKVNNKMCVSCIHKYSTCNRSFIYVIT